MTIFKVEHTIKKAERRQVFEYYFSDFEKAMKFSSRNLKINLHENENFERLKIRLDNKLIHSDGCIYCSIPFFDHDRNLNWIRINEYLVNAIEV